MSTNLLKKVKTKDKKLIILGASGHGKVILDIALKNQYEVLGFLDDDETKTELAGYPVLGKIASLPQYKDETEVVFGIGSNQIRQRLSEQYPDVQWATLIHPSAIIGMDAAVGAGTVVMAGAVINPFAQVGKHCIINTAAVVEHDNRLGDFVHISPKAVLAGTVNVGNRTQIGVGAAVRNNITICPDCIIGAGAVVVKDIIEPGTYTGVPAERRA